MGFYISPQATNLVHPYPMELSEFQLYSGAARVGAAITPTCNLAPTSGTLAALKDDLTTVGVYWADTSVVPMNGIRLYWEFPTPVDVDGILIGHRTTAVRAVGTVMMIGYDSLTAPLARTVRGSPNIRWVSAAKTAILPLTGPYIGHKGLTLNRDYSVEGGRGLITDTVKTKGASVNVPTFCKVRLVRDVDGKVFRETWTNPVTGVYTFDNFDENYTYTVVAIHPSGALRAVIADRLIPGLMP